MGLLDGDLQAIVGGIFGPIFLDATLHTGRRQDYAGGRPVGDATWVDVPCKGMVDQYAEGYKARNNIPDTDVKVILLQAGMPNAPSLDDEFTIRGVRYVVQSPITQDPAMATWEFRGKPVRA